MAWGVCSTGEVHSKDACLGIKSFCFDQKVTMADTLDILTRIQAKIIEARRLAAETVETKLADILLCIANEIERRAREVDRDGL
jgi:hypothetical protein